MLSTDEALSRLLSLITPVPVETIPLADACGRVLAITQTARRTQPPFAASAMDGYAVRAGEAEPGAQLNVIGEAAAGSHFDGSLSEGQAVRIFTGAPVPDGADEIVIQEDVTRDGDRITIHKDRDRANYIRPAGGDFKQGAPLDAPRRLTPQDIALLAAMNIPEIPVRKRPRIALIPTGDELVSPGETPGPDQIISSNNFGLKALLESHGASVALLPIARDNASSLAAAFDLAREADMIVTLGGASVGDHDLVRDVAGDNGLDLDFYKIAMRPGKPLMAGLFGGTPMIGLPGNPVSSMVCGHIFLRPALDAILGLPARALPRKTARLAHALGPNGPREHYMRGSVHDGECEVFERQDSSLLSVLSRANALVVRVPFDEARAKGAEVSFIPL